MCRLECGASVWQISSPDHHGVTSTDQQIETCLHPSLKTNPPGATHPVNHCQSEQRQDPIDSHMVLRDKSKMVVPVYFDLQRRAILLKSLQVCIVCPFLIFHDKCHFVCFMLITDHYGAEGFSPSKPADLSQVTLGNADKPDAQRKKRTPKLK